MRCRLGWIAFVLFNSGLDSPLTFDIGRTLGLDTLLFFISFKVWGWIAF